jgi:hypothetical protein
MPFKSQKQRAKFFSMAEHGEMPMSTVQEWQKATGKAKLPLYAPKKKKIGKSAEERGETRPDNEKKEKHK